MVLKADYNSWKNDSKFEDWLLSCSECNTWCVGNKDTKHRCKPTEPAQPIDSSTTATSNGSDYRTALIPLSAKSIDRKRILYAHDIFSYDNNVNIDAETNNETWFESNDIEFEEAKIILARHSFDIGSDDSLGNVYYNKNNITESHKFTMAVDKWIPNNKYSVFNKVAVNGCDNWFYSNPSYKYWVYNYFVTSKAKKEETCVVREGTCSSQPPCDYYTIKTTFRARKGESSKNPLPQNFQHTCKDKTQKTCNWGPMASDFSQLPYAMRRFIWLRYRQTVVDGENENFDLGPLEWEASRQ